MKRLIDKTIAYFVLLFIIGNCSFASESKPEKKTYRTVRVSEEAPHIDGVFDDPVWNTLEWEGGFIQLEPYEMKTPSQHTQFKILYDDNNLYVAIQAFDSYPDSIVRRMSRRDGFEGDWVEINIDSYFDKRTAFSFSVNAAGVKGDEAITNGDNWDSSWDPIWYVKTSIDGEGWNAEMQIPLTQLRFSDKEQHIWGLQLNRRLFRHEERSSWQFISPNASGWVHNFGELHGINSIEPQKQRDLTPYVVTRLEHYEKDSDNPFADGRDVFASAGLDGKFGITNNLTLDFSINPDFGQVEADPSEVNLTTFETFLREKRSFFIEGKEILSHQVTNGGPMRRDNLFYSRRIGKRPTYYPDLEDDEYVDMPDNTTIMGAFKLTGKTPEGWSIGVMESVTQRELAEIDTEGDRRSVPVEPLTNYFATRLARDFNNSNTTIGGMVTATNRDLESQELQDIMHRSAYAGGVNILHQWKDKTYYVLFNSAFSVVNGSKEAITETQTSAPHFFQRPNADNFHVDSNRTSLSGYGGNFQIGKNGNGKVSFTNWITWRSPGFNLNDMGYMQRTDEIQQVFWIGYRENEPFSIFRRAGINYNLWSGFTFDGQVRYLGTNINAYAQFKNHWGTGFSFSREDKNMSTVALRGGPSLVYDGTTSVWGHFYSDNRKKLNIGVEGGSNFRDHHQDLSYNLGVDIEYQVSDAFKLSVYPNYHSRVDKLAYVATVDSLSDDRYIRGEINQNTVSLTLRFSFNLTPDFTIQGYAMPFISAGEYNNFKYINDPQASEYSERYISYTNNQVLPEINSDGEITYYIDEDNDNVADFGFGNPNFNSMDFNSNLVLRWEYKPGSTFYIVWSQHRYKGLDRGTFRFWDDAEQLFDQTYPHDVFLAKFSYRFGV